MFFKESEEAGPRSLSDYDASNTGDQYQCLPQDLIHQRVVLLPRSELAAWYHKVGRTMKIAFAVIGAFGIFSMIIIFFAGLVAGSLVAE